MLAWSSTHPAWCPTQERAITFQTVFREDQVFLGFLGRWSRGAYPCAACESSQDADGEDEECRTTHCFTASSHISPIQRAKCTLVGRLATSSPSTACQQSSRNAWKEGPDIIVCCQARSMAHFQIKLQNTSLRPDSFHTRLPQACGNTSSWKCAQG